jgi:hypothetical protein
MEKSKLLLQSILANFIFPFTTMESVIHSVKCPSMPAFEGTMIDQLSYRYNKSTRGVLLTKITKLTPISIVGEKRSI